MRPTARSRDEPAAATTAAGAVAAAAREKPRAAKNDAAKRNRPTRIGRPTSQTRDRVRVAQGVYKDRWGLAATVKVNGIQRELRFPPGTPLKAVRARRDELRASLRTLAPGERHTLAHDAERYLQQVSGELVSMADRRHHIGLWVQRFGHLRTLELAQHVALLNDQLHQWRETLSASACNHRRNALTNLVKVLYGRRAAAELIDLVRFAQPPPKPRWLERSHIAEVLAQLTPGSRTVVRLRLMHWTGMRPSQMARLQPDDFRLDEPTPFVVAPRGKGGRLAAIPLVGEGLKAAREFMAIRAYGSWSCPARLSRIECCRSTAARRAHTARRVQEECWPPTRTSSATTSAKRWPTPHGAARSKKSRSARIEAPDRHEPVPGSTAPPSTAFLRFPPEHGRRCPDHPKSQVAERVADPLWAAHSSSASDSTNRTRSTCREMDSFW